MRGWLAITLASAVALSLGACDGAGGEKAEPEAKAPLPTPTRKAGLWKQTMGIEGMPISQTAELCLDARADKEISWWAQQGVRGGCTENDIRQNADGAWVFSSVCDLAGGIRTTTEGQASGDFQSSYKVTAKSTTVGAPMAEMNGTRTVSIDAEWAGECPASMKAGDMRLPDGRMMNLLEIADAPQP